MADKIQDKSTDKERNLQLALAKIEKDFGKGAIMRLGETQTYRYMFTGDRHDVIIKGVNAAIFRALKFITREVVR